MLRKETDLPLRTRRKLLQRRSPVVVIFLAVGAVGTVPVLVHPRGVMHDGITTLHRRRICRGIARVSVNKRVAATVGQIFQIAEIARVG